MSRKRDKPLRIESPAKINLFLYVVGKRADGYHDLVSLMCPISLHDTISISFGHRDPVVTCTDPKVPGGAANLAFRAAMAFSDRMAPEIKEKARGVRIDIEKRIPAGAGLGGGSSNAASVLLALNRHFGYPVDKPGLASLALSIGADVPFFIEGKPALATGVGEKLEPVEGLKPYAVVLIFPGIQVSTAEVFRELNFGLTKPARKPKERPFEKSGFDPRRDLYNDLEKVTAARHGVVLRMKEALITQGAAEALMTGSGPTVFGLFDTTEKAAKAAAAITGTPGWAVFQAKLRL